jgi:hypothetical protein
MKEKMSETQDMADVTGCEMWLYSNKKIAAANSDRARELSAAGLSVVFVARLLKAAGY